jgi:UDP-GlcNAc:undecaprenyl-phosphate GlcNAc-1-phosphate transferase
MTNVGVFLIASFVVLISTPLVRRLGLHYGYVDRPNERKVHQTPIVRVGGIAICSGTFIALLAVWAIAGFPVQMVSDRLPILGIVCGGLSFFAIGLADDVFNLAPTLRLGLQAITVLGVWSLGVRVEHLPLPFLETMNLGFLSLPITFLWLSGVSNAINWLDGLDGLAAGITTIAAIALGVASWQSHPAIALIALALAGATLAFLRYNASPAQIFMGDGGSYFIGFTLAAVGAMGCMTEATPTHLWLPYLVLAVPILDMTLVILARLFSGKSPLFPDRRHIHHRLLQLGLSRQQTVWVIYGLVLLSGWGAITLSYTATGFIALASSAGLMGLSLSPLWQQQALQVQEVPVVSYITSPKIQ